MQGRGRVDHVADGCSPAGARLSRRGVDPLDPDANVDGLDVPRLGHGASVRRDLVDHAQRRAGRAIEIVVAAGGNAEVGADRAVGMQLHHAAVLRGDPREALQALVDELLRALGGEALPERGGTDDVGDEGGDRPQLVLAQHGGRGAYRRRSLGYVDLDPRVADDEHVAGREPGRLLDALSVHPGAVQRAQVLDLDALLNGPNSGVPPRDLRVVEEQVGALTPDDELGRGLDRLTGQRTGGHLQPRLLGRGALRPRRQGTPRSGSATRPRPPPGAAARPR